MKNSLCQSLYEYVFQRIVYVFNGNNSDIGANASQKNDSTLWQINLLDIAGFGTDLFFISNCISHKRNNTIFFIESFDTNNHFEQLCINFVNEKIQQMFVKRMIKNEEEWYASENLELPKIQFLDNSSILGMFLFI